MALQIWWVCLGLPQYIPGWQIKVANSLRPSRGGESEVGVVLRAAAATLVYEASPSGVKEAIPGFPIELLLTNLKEQRRETFTNLSTELKLAKITNPGGTRSSLSNVSQWLWLTALTFKGILKQTNKKSLQILKNILTMSPMWVSFSICHWCPFSWNIFLCVCKLYFSNNVSDVSVTFSICYWCPRPLFPSFFTPSKF